MNQRSIKWIIHLIGPVAFVILLLRMNLYEIWQILLSVKPFYLLLAIVSQIISNILKSERWRVIIGLYQDLPFIHVLRTSVYGGLYASFTPARVGEGFKAPLIKNPNLNYSQIFFTIILDRLLDVLTIVITGYIGLVYLRDVVKIDNYVLPVITIGLVLVLFTAYYLCKRLSVDRFNGHVDDKLSGIKKWFYSNWNLVKHHIMDFSVKSEFLKKKFLKVILINMLSYSFYFIAAYFVVLSIDIDVSFIFMVLSFSVVALLGMLPISISGIGTRDISLIFFFNILGIPAEKAIAVSMIDLIVINYCVILFLLGILSILNLLIKTKHKKLRT